MSGDRAKPSIRKLPVTDLFIFYNDLLDIILHSFVVSLGLAFCQYFMHLFILSFSSHNVTLEVKASQGGVWKFPIQFLALEPPVDDLIDIEATGLGKESYVGFRLTSQTKYVIFMLIYLYL